MDPTAATGMFIAHLLKVSGWASLPAWQAAQAVQRSAFSNGSNYKKHWVASGVYLAKILHLGQTAGSCGQGVPGGVIGPSSAYGLPVGYTVPIGTPAKAAIAVNFAIAQLGKSYVWGAAGPNSFDCSGLTQAAWKAAGINLDHYTGDQQNEGAQVTPSAVQPGDLVLTPGTDSPGPGVAGHVGIYLGNGLVESAIDPAMGIQVQSWTTFISGGLTAVRNPAG
jgi:cell wall-associated NlpC family hydrolase